MVGTKTRSVTEAPPEYAFIRIIGLLLRYSPAVGQQTDDILSPIVRIVE